SPSGNGSGDPPCRMVRVVLMLTTAPPYCLTRLAKLGSCTVEPAAAGAGWLCWIGWLGWLCCAGAVAAGGPSSEEREQPASSKEQQNSDSSARWTGFIAYPQ